MKRDKDHTHRVRYGDGVFISPVGTTKSRQSLTFMPVSTVLRRWESFVLSASEQGKCLLCLPVSRNTPTDSVWYTRSDLHDHVWYTRSDLHDSVWYTRSDLHDHETLLFYTFLSDFHETYCTVLSYEHYHIGIPFTYVWQKRKWYCLNVTSNNNNNKSENDPLQHFLHHPFSEPQIH